MIRHRLPHGRGSAPLPNRECKRPVLLNSSWILSILFQQISGDDQPLQLISSTADNNQRRVPIVALHRKILGIPISAEDAHRLQRHFSWRVGSTHGGLWALEGIEI